MEVQTIRKRTEAMRRHFNAAVCRELGVSDRYQRVSVLLIRWDEQLDKDLRCTKETEDLEKVFRENYGFTTQTATLDCRQSKPEAQLNLHIASFVHQHDGHHRGTLLIVYYSGHGTLDKVEGEDQFFISGTIDPRQTAEHGQTAYIPRANWKIADSCLQSADADVLTIMDCCYAAEIMKNGGNNTRTFETLAATDRITPMPGPSSYTNALIATLREEYEKYKANKLRSFDTYHLDNRIRKRLESQAPKLLNRLQSSIVRHIRLVPLEVSQKRKVSHPAPANRCMSSVYLQIDLANKTFLSEKESAKLGRHLAEAANRTELQITGLDMVNFVSNAGSHVQSMFNVTMLLQKAMARRLRKKRVRSAEEWDSEPEPRKRQHKAVRKVPGRDLTPPSSVDDQSSGVPGSDD